MEKKVNLTIFFNYRNYSPRFKLLLEDVFYKKMHDEKISSSDSMQQVMQFCNDVDAIEYDKIEEEKVLSRYNKNEKRIIINESAINNLLEEHKDLDEEALLKNIFGKQVQNILSVSEEDTFDVTFEDILNKNGYVTPRRLSDLAANGENVTTDSILNEIVGEKYLKTNANNVGSSNDSSLFTESKNQDFETQNSYMKKDTFASFEENDTSMYSDLDSVPKLNTTKEDFDYDVAYCVRRKDDDSNVGAFSDFVNKSQIDVDYTLEDEENYGDLKKHKKHKSSKGFLSGMKSKMSSIKEKVFSKKDDEFDDYIDDFETNQNNNKEKDMSSFLGDFNYLDEKEKMKNESSSTEDAENIIKDNKQVEEEFKNSATVVDNFDYSSVEDIDVDKKFDSIIEAIMKEKRGSISKFNTEKIDTQSINQELENPNMSAVEEIPEEKKDNSSIYDAFAEELETVESIRRRRRGK